MKSEEFYGSAYSALKLIEKQLLALLEYYSTDVEDSCDLQPIVYMASRIKKPERMLEKLKKHGYEPTLEAALNDVYDAVGVRAVCAFAEDVYRLVRWIKERSGLKVLIEKDYYANAKPNGYRSYHMILRIKADDGKQYYAELQIRTIANDFWAVLDHRLGYKKDSPHKGVIQEELKRCAFEIASVDASMQAIRDLMNK